MTLQEAAEKVRSLTAEHNKQWDIINGLRGELSDAERKLGRITDELYVARQELLNAALRGDRDVNVNLIIDGKQVSEAVAFKIL